MRYVSVCRRIIMVKEVGKARVRITDVSMIVEITVRINVTMTVRVWDVGVVVVITMREVGMREVGVI
jgi:hypothetical protein